MADLIDAYLIHLRRRGRSDATIETYCGVLRRLHTELPMGLAAACTEELEDWIYREGRSPATVRLYRAAVRSFFGWACDPRAPRLDFDPSTLLPDAPSLPTRLPRPLSVEQFADILARARRPFRLWYTLAGYAGLRCVEIAALDREHVTPDTLWIQGKGAHEREVPTHPEVWAAVRDLPPGPVARHADGRRVSRKHLSTRGNDYLHEDLGVGEATMHALRRTFATIIYQATGDIEVVRALLGHASVATTQRHYTRVAGRQLAAAVATLPRLSSVAAGAAAAPARDGA